MNTGGVGNDPVLQDFLKGIESVRPRMERLILFGSRTRGTHQLDSDYDLLLVVAKKDNALVVSAPIRIEASCSSVKTGKFDKNGKNFSII